MTIPPELERVVLQIVRDGGDKASWHYVATRVPSYDVPLNPDSTTVLKDLLARGLVTRELLDGGMDRWTITPAGEAVLAGKSQPGPLSEGELQQLMGALRGDAMTSTRALIPLVGDGLKMLGALRQVLAADPALAQAVAAAALFMPVSERGPFARELAGDPRPEVRAALFRAWTPVKTDVPGNPLPTLPDAELDELLRGGLLDASFEVREAAATLAFLAVRGGSLVGELVANLGVPARGVQWWSILALGAARDPISHEMLAERLVHGDAATASAAARALGARPDGREAWRTALHDPRPDVKSAACFALATVVTGLSDTERAALRSDPDPDVRGALAAYEARVASRSA